MTELFHKLDDALGELELSCSPTRPAGPKPLSEVLQAKVAMAITRALEILEPVVAEVLEAEGGDYRAGSLRLARETQARRGVS